MLKALEITVYDLFGYLMPGALLLFSTWVAFHTAFWTTEPLPIWIILSPQGIAVVLVLAYFFGHLGQGAANLLQRVPLLSADRGVLLPEEARRSLEGIVSSRFNIKADMLSVLQLYELCDETLLYHGSLGEREIFTYREGFYRATSVAFLGMLLASLQVLFFAPIQASVTTRNIELGKSVWIFVSAFAAISSYISFER